jgi:hypothetical protein
MTLAKWEIGIRILCFLAASAFVVRYSFVRWYRYPEGIVLMSMTAILTAFLGLVVSAALFGRYDWYSVVANVLFCLTFITLVLQSRNLYKAQAEGRLTSQLLRRKSPQTYRSTLFERRNMDKIIPYMRYGAKAIYAGAAALIGGVIIALTPDSVNISSITTLEKWTIAGTVLAAVGGVFKLDNGPKPGETSQTTPYPV